MRLLIDISKRSADYRVFEAPWCGKSSHTQCQPFPETHFTPRPSQRPRTFQLGWVSIEFGRGNSIVDTGIKQTLVARLTRRIRRHRALELSAESSPSELPVYNNESCWSKQHCIGQIGSHPSELATESNPQELPTPPPMTPIIVDNGGLYELESPLVTNLPPQDFRKDLVPEHTLNVVHHVQSKREDLLERMAHPTSSFALATPEFPPRLLIGESSLSPPGMTSANSSLTPSPVSPTTPSSTDTKYATKYQHFDVSPINNTTASQQPPSLPLRQSLIDYENEFEDEEVDWPLFPHCTRASFEYPVPALQEKNEQIFRHQYAQNTIDPHRQIENETPPQGRALPVAAGPYLPFSTESSQYTFTSRTYFEQESSNPTPSATHPAVIQDGPHRTSSRGLSGENLKWHRKLCRAGYARANDATDQPLEMYQAPTSLHGNQYLPRIAQQQVDAGAQSFAHGFPNMNNAPDFLHSTKHSANNDQQALDADSYTQINHPCEAYDISSLLRGTDESTSSPLRQFDTDIEADTDEFANGTQSSRYPKEYCTHCDKAFTGKYGKGNCARHVRQKHGLMTATFDKVCRVCKHAYNRADAKRKHEWKKHRMLDSRPNKRRKKYGET